MCRCGCAVSRRRRSGAASLFRPHPQGPPRSCHQRRSGRSQSRVCVRLLSRQWRRRERRSSNRGRSRSCKPSSRYRSQTRSSDPCWEEVRPHQPRCVASRYRRKTAIRFANTHVTCRRRQPRNSVFFWVTADRRRHRNHLARRASAAIARKLSRNSRASAPGRQPGNLS